MIVLWSRQFVMIPQTITNQSSSFFLFIIPVVGLGSRSRSFAARWSIHHFDLDNTASIKVRSRKYIVVPPPTIIHSFSFTNADIISSALTLTLTTWVCFHKHYLYYDVGYNPIRNSLVTISELLFTNSSYDHIILFPTTCFTWEIPSLISFHKLPSLGLTLGRTSGRIDRFSPRTLYHSNDDLYSWTSNYDLGITY